MTNKIIITLNLSLIIKMFHKIASRYMNSNTIFSK